MTDKIDQNVPLETLELLRCPQSGAELVPNRDGTSLSTINGITYPVICGKPVLIPGWDQLPDRGISLWGGLLPKTDKTRTLIYDHESLDRLADLPRDVSFFTFMELFSKAYQGKSDETWKINPPLLAAGQCLYLARQIANHKSLVLDVGCGTARYRAVFQGCRYLGFDIAAPTFDYDYKHLDWVADANFDFGLKDAIADLVLSLAVLEHLQKPWIAANEFARVLRPDGHLIVLAPFVRTEHAQPHDYFRFTRWGLQSLMEGVGLTTVKIWNAVGTRTTLAWLEKIVAIHRQSTTPISGLKRKFSRRRLRSALRLAANLDEKYPLPDFFPHAPAYVIGHFVRKLK